MGSIKLTSYLFDGQRKIQSHGKNTCVVDHVWEQVRGKRGVQSYDYDKVKTEIYKFVDNSPRVITEELVNWAKECHTNVSIRAFDPTYKKLLSYIGSNLHAAVTLVYYVKDHHWFPYH